MEQSPLALELLNLLGEQEAADGIEIGGGIALWHYSPHRHTNDIDAWWPEESLACSDAIARVMASVAARHGLEVVHRAMAGYQSWDLKRERKTVFAFQIARKSRRLEPSIPIIKQMFWRRRRWNICWGPRRSGEAGPAASPWGKLRMESLRENIANKMTALVQRGAPRDFLDIAAVVSQGFLGSQDCWHLWRQKNPDFSMESGRANILKYLNALEARRPLTSIADGLEREQACFTRDLMRAFAQENCHGD